jgi:hypothetical protein
MATLKSVGKSGFLKEFFVDHPGAGKAAVNKAWQEAGNEGTISESLISQTRRALGLTGKSRTKAKPKAGTGKLSSGKVGAEPRVARTNVRTGGERPAEPRSSGRVRTPLLIRLEGQIDDMLHEIRIAGGLPEFEETLRKARRILVRRHEE